MSSSALDAPTGALLIATTAVVTVAEWTGAGWATLASDLLVVPLVALLAVQVAWARRVFVAVGLGLAAFALATRGDWATIVGRALETAAFIAAFFTALATLRNAAASSPAIARCGRFLTRQPPGRRYAALTVGGQLFGILLNYGALVLLGTLAEADARTEPNAEIRGHRIRRMLLAVQRGFVSTLAWSPLAFAIAITTALIPGAVWAETVGPCLVSGAILALLGWALDTIFKPRLSTRPPKRTPEGTWLTLWPLLALLALLAASIVSLQALAGVRTVGVVMLVVPLVSAAWILMQAEPPGRGRTLAGRARAYTVSDLPAYRGEIVLLMMAGFIGTLGAGVLAPLVAASGVDLSALGGWPLMVAFVWIIPAAGQIGMNPILSVSLMAPLLPAPAAMGLTPTDVIVALTAGWALSGASSPYTATTLLIGTMGGVSARHVGLRWNGLYTLLAGLALSVWVAAVALY